MPMTRLMELRHALTPARLTVVAHLVAAAVFVLLFAPAAASAAEGCLFQGLKPSAKTAGNVERSLLCLTNLHRVRNGLEPLRRDTRLSKAARAHSADMVARDYFDHTTPEGRGPSDRARAAGYPGGAGENIAASSGGSAFSLFDAWRGSPGHNENMLGGGYATAGFGVVRGFPGGGGGGTGTQMFSSAGANTGDTALGLYASSGRCAKAKKGHLRLRAKLRATSRAKAKRKRALRRKAGRARARVNRVCEPATP
jgi:uncharacterized protein YkwD